MKKQSLFLLFTLFFIFSDSLKAQNYALDFDGVNDYTYSSSVGALTNKTLSAWVRLDDVNQNGTGIINIESASVHDFDALTYNETASGIGWGFGSDGWQRTAWSGVKETNTNQWVHIAATYEDYSYKIYRNGELILHYTAKTARVFPADTKIYLGVRCWSQYGILNGQIDEVRVWNYVRSQEQIQDDMNSQLTGNEAGLVAYYQMSDGSGASLSDNSATSYQSTISGATWIQLVSSTPSLTTSAASSISSNSATISGVIGDTDWTYTSGLCWSTTGTPTITDNASVLIYGGGNISESISSLSTNTTYYVRTYTTNNAGLTTYGNEISFTTTAETNGDWQTQNITLYNTSEADIMVRSGDVDNLGYGWPNGFDPFSGNSTPAHTFPFDPEGDDVAGTDNNLRPTSCATIGRPCGNDGYWPTAIVPTAIALNYDLDGTTVLAATIQMFVDDFQASMWCANYTVSIDGVNAPFFADVINSLSQTGPIGKIITVALPAEYIPLVADGSISILIDDFTTGAGDGFAIDFVKLLINASGFTYSGTISGTVTDGGNPISGATVEASSISTTTNAAGEYTLENVPAGQVLVEASKVGYSSSSTLINLVSDADETANFTLTSNAVTWDGSSSTDWNTAANWSSNSVPTSANDVVIANTATQPIIAVSANADCHNLTINSGAVLTLENSSSGWASLITAGTIYNNGTINIKKYFTKEVWHYISLPNITTTSNTFLDDYLQSWSEPTHTWTQITGTTNELSTPLQGYGFWGTADKASPYTFTGTPNTGALNIPLTYNELNDDELPYDGANLLGNPYPSSIDWSQLDGDVWGAVYYWNSTNGLSASWNNNSATNSGSQYIPPMQGFFIVVDEASTFYLTNSNRTHERSAQYFKTTETTINGLTLEASNGTIKDEWCLVFNKQSSESFELKNDAYKFFSNTDGITEIFSISNETNFAIDVRPETEQIQLGFKNNQNGYYSIGLKEIDGIGLVEIEDTKTNTFHDISKETYQFDWNKTDSEERFILHLKATATQEIAEQEAQVYSYDGQVYIRQTSSMAFQTMQIFDLAGRVVYSGNLNQDELQSINLSNLKGAYLVQLNGDKMSQSEKVILN